MSLVFDIDSAAEAIELRGIFASERDATYASLTPMQQNALNFSGFKAASGSFHPVLNSQGQTEIMLFGKGEPETWQDHHFGLLSRSLPQAIYALAGKPSLLTYISWALGAYHFDRYVDSPDNRPQLLVPDAQIAQEIAPIIYGAKLARDLINTPANDLGPFELAQAIGQLANDYGVEASFIEGDALLSENFPLIHTVGRAASTHRQPRLAEFSWKGGERLTLTLVGKGIVYDTGGLNIKPGASMDLMKKDMGGSAHALALAFMIMEARLPINLRVIIPIADNSISGDSFRPGDVYPSRSGKWIEIGNTDAEGRLVLADALTYAGEKQSDLVIDFATLTGAARVALGPDIAPFYTNSHEWAASIFMHSQQQEDPVWEMPLYQGYKSLLSSKIADINHISSGAFAGSITAALFLQEFVPENTDWIHFDIYAWANRDKPMCLQGGDLQGVRAVFAAICERVLT